MPGPTHGEPDATAVDHPQASSPLGRIWLRHRATIFRQVAVIEHAVLALRRGSVDGEQCARAVRASHKLAGSLGTLGFPQTTAAAIELERLLAQPAALEPAQTQHAHELILGIRDALLEPPAVSLPLPEQPRPAGRTATVLVIDGDADLAERFAAEGMLRGLRPRIAVSPAEGRRLAAQERPDAALLGLTFDDGTEDALELLSQLTAEPASVPVIVLTMQDSFVDRVEVARRGGRGFAPRSVPVPQVFDQVVQLLERTRRDVVTLLAVDDDRVVLDTIATLLAPQGIDVVAQDDPLAVWQQIERTRPDVVLLDVDMPGVDGINLCRVLRNDPRWATVPVLFLTEHADPETLQRVFDAGADDYLTKPVVPAELLARIRNRLDRGRLHQLLADTDALTGVPNRRSSLERLERLVQLARRFGEPLSLAVIDLDGFKGVNDSYGHALGDAVLRRMGDLLRQAFRGEDVVGRWGGEEFVVGMYGMGAGDAMRRLQDLLDTFSREQFEADDGELFHVSFSAGTAESDAHATGVDELHRAADAALYRAKAAGRARIVAASPHHHGQLTIT
ncbi:diguanylate cyclase [Conexibacter sp. CPCC 206217]|uniref:diguanylate cyclase n=1 Tax=Conexibacter sp. CPCC 206217 TaxID=3064574 RepID=UPI00272863CE|nr:diguanylate cyclase [Conexibacter sp. CPCC 206217]MDO8212400.1 diguanylate cyclase [Conexibacter sp. CPCC 206217]